MAGESSASAHSPCHVEEVVPHIRMVSVMAQNFDGLYRAVAEFLSHDDLQVELVESPPWPERERMLRRGEVDMGFICGLPYVQEADRAAPRLALLAAPIIAAPRYLGRPLYFSDVVVRADRAFRTLEDLRGARWAYNEPNSQSGYNLTCWTLAMQGERAGFFGDVVEAGAHQTSLRLVLDGVVDASSIDSTVLEMEMRRDPSLSRRLRVIATFGPSPIPPAVVSTRLSADVVERLRARLLTMRGDVLDEHGIAKYVRVEDRVYDPIRAMVSESHGARLGRSLHVLPPDMQAAG